MSNGEDPSTAPLGTGHVFLAHGRMECVGHDVAIVPTDRWFSVRSYWDTLLGSVEGHRPRGWPIEYAQSARDEAVWFIDVGDLLYGGHSTLTSRVRSLLETVRDTHRRPSGPETQPLRVAMPVLGVAGGGLGERRGEVLAILLEELHRITGESGIDVVLVTPDPSLFSAAQHWRRQQRPWRLPPSLHETAQDIGALAKGGYLSLFLGAGASVPAGLPTWAGLLQTLGQAAGVATEDLTGLPTVDQAQIIERRTGQTLGPQVADIVRSAHRPSLAHALLAGLACRQAVTTNYDRLYEAAVRATGRAVTTILPWEAVAPGHPWILKMHGDVEHPEQIVLTRRQFVRYDAATRPAGSLLQSLLLTSHLLIVGASLGDDNVARLAYEVDEFRRAHGLRQPFGTFLNIDGPSARRELWSDELTWVDLPGDSLDDRARAMQILLDAAAAYASTDSSWLLDPRFAGMLDVGNQELAQEARSLLERLEGRPGPFDELARMLRTFGAPQHEEMEMER